MLRTLAVLSSLGPAPIGVILKRQTIHRRDGFCAAAASASLETSAAVESYATDASLRKEASNRLAIALPMVPTCGGRKLTGNWTSGLARFECHLDHGKTAWPCPDRRRNRCWRASAAPP
jgi:hypothetical protein